MRLDFPNVNGDINIYMDVMRAICGDTYGKSMVDLCCHKAPNTPQLGFANRTYVDVIEQKLDIPEEQRFFVKQDARQFLRFTPIDDYDVAFCLDGIEHLLHDEGIELLNLMYVISKKQILFTPLTDLFGMAQPDNKDPEAHRSLWSPEMLPGLAYIVFPNYHKVWNGGAFFIFHCVDLEQDFERVKQILLTKPWAK